MCFLQISRISFGGSLLARASTQSLRGSYEHLHRDPAAGRSPACFHPKNIQYLHNIIALAPHLHRTTTHLREKWALWTTPPYARPPRMRRPNSWVRRDRWRAVRRYGSASRDARPCSAAWIWWRMPSRWEIHRRYHLFLNVLTCQAFKGCWVRFFFVGSSFCCIRAHKIEWRRLSRPRQRSCWHR